MTADEPQAQPIDWSPCLGYKLCEAACPVGAINTDGGFDFAACTTHNYRGVTRIVGATPNPEDSHPDEVR